MRRRDFLKWTGAGSLSMAAGPRRFLSLGEIGNRNSGQNASDLLTADYPFPYDSQFFDAAERIVFLNSQEASLNILPRPGVSLDIKIFKSVNDTYLAQTSPLSFYGVNDSLEVSLKNFFWGPELYYRIEYKDTREKGNWRATPGRRVKTPLSNLRNGKLEVIMISDDHTFDDADMGDRVVGDKTLRELRLNGDYVNMFLKDLMTKPGYLPDSSTDLGKLMSGFCLASTIRHILTSESPDFIVIMGDTTGIGAGYKWKGLGLKDPTFGLPPQDLDDYSRLFWIRMRKMYSGLTPTIPIYIALGNHDGEAAYDASLIPAIKYRRKYFRQPGLEGGNSSDENYYALAWGQDWMGQSGKLFVILDSERYNNPLRLPLTPEEWTLGTGQKEWFKRALCYESDWKFVFFHHVLGGWPKGTNEAVTEYAYGRGPLFTYEDYKLTSQNPDAIEQVELTKIMMEAGVRINFYGHDHISHFKEIGKNAFGKKMYGICTGSIKHQGELLWYKGTLWQKYYGSYGFYCSENVETHQTPTFWGPSGYTKLTISRDGAKVEYKRSAYNHPYTNILPQVKVGDTLSGLLL